MIPSLHSAIANKHAFGSEIVKEPTLPLKFSEYQEGGTFNYLLRIGGWKIFLSSTANFIEREVERLDPDIAIIASGLRQEIYHYTCRLLQALDHPPYIFPNHFDNWKKPAKGQKKPPRRTGISR